MLFDQLMGVAASGWGSEVDAELVLAAQASLSIDNHQMAAYSDMSGSVAQLVRAERS